MKFKTAIIFLITLIFILFGVAIYLSIDLVNTKKKLEQSYNDLEDHQEKLKEYQKELESKIDSEQAFWEVAKTSNLVSAFLDYKIKFGGDSIAFSKKADDAIVKMLVDGDYYVQTKDGQNGKTYFKQYDTSIKVSDYWVVKEGNDLNVRYGVIGANKNKYPDATKNTSKTGDIIRKDDIVQFIGDPIPSGKAEWHKITFQKRE